MVERNVLIVHYHFLPVHNVSVKRLVGYARHLPAFGWRAHVLTREWRGVWEADPSWGLSWEPHLEASSRCVIHRVSSVAVVRTNRPAKQRSTAERNGASDHWRRARRLGARIARLGRMASGNYPDEFVRWVRPALEAGERLARSSRIDVVMSYCPPETNHVVGRRLAARIGVPWVPFFGDMYGFLAPRAYTLENRAGQAWHRWCLGPAAACAGVSPAMVEYLATTYGKPSHLIHTGFDPEDFAGPEPSNDRFTVSHVGSIYPGDQRPEIFFDGLDLLLTRHPEAAEHFNVIFVGSKCDDQLHRMLAGRPAGRVCSILPKVDSITALSMVRSSDALLAFTCTRNRDRFGTMSYPTKIFEAFGAQRPVLAVPADGDWVDDLLARTGGGVSAADAEGVAVTLLDWFRGWLRDGRAPYHPRSQEFLEFTRRRQTEHLATVFNEICPV